MSDDTSPVLSLPLILPGQAQKHVTHNEALRLLDLLVQPAAQSRTTSLPPAGANLSDRWIVPVGATGAWAGQTGMIAVAEATGWSFLSPLPGWQVHVLDEARSVYWSGAVWQSPNDQIQDFPQLGVATTPDATNRLAVASDASLFTHAGAGHQMKLNKSAPSDTASVLFQTGWSGRAEMGTAGDDNFSIKVSPDGSTWNTVLSASATNGTVAFGQPIAVESGGTGAVSAAGARTALELGNAATQDTTTSPTDATAGRIMLVGSFGIGAAIDIPGIDLASDHYGAWANATDNQPPTVQPDGQAGPARWAGVTLGADTARLQLAQRCTGSGQRHLWARARSGADWQAWRRMVDTHNILGTVSQSAGTPTGAIIERGTNANGDYMRWADGTQICLHASAVSNRVAGSANLIDWTFPAAFVPAHIPLLFAVPRSFNTDENVEQAARYLRAAARGISNNAARFCLVNSHSATVNGGLTLQAIGRWF